MTKAIYFLGDGALKLYTERRKVLIVSLYDLEQRYARYRENGGVSDPDKLVSFEENITFAKEEIFLLELVYQTAMELLAEKFHMEPGIITTGVV